MHCWPKGFVSYSLPATTPETRVAATGLCLLLILLSGLKKSPSLAMAKRTRGIGNIDPSRLWGGGGGHNKITNQRLRKVWLECVFFNLVDNAQRDPTATAYLAGPQPMYVKATGRGL